MEAYIMVSNQNLEMDAGRMTKHLPETFRGGFKFLQGNKNIQI